MRLRWQRLAFSLGALALVGASTPAPVPLEIGEGERLLVVAPHPDDETLGSGGLVQRVLARGGTACVLLFTAGDGYVEAVEEETGLPKPRPSDYIAYGQRRLAEVRAALRELGGDRVRLRLLGFPDGGLERLLYAHWQRAHPERSNTTHATGPPYPEALDPTVAYDGADLLRETERVLREVDPTIVALPDPEDAHPDHSATGLFTLLALDARSGSEAGVRPYLPRMLTYLVHWSRWPTGWNHPASSLEDTPLELPKDFMPHRARAFLTLGDEERATKKRALERYRSQQETMGSLLAAFVRRTEPFTVLTESDLDHLTVRIERRIDELQTSKGR